MYKNLLKSITFAALALVAGACAKENEKLEGPSTVTFEVSTPEIVTKAIGDGMTATKLYYQVFDADGNAIKGLGVQNKDLVLGKTTVSFQLIKDQTYNFIFWAQTAEAGYYIIDEAEGLKKITADYTTHKGANDENRDAFFAVEKGLKIKGPVSKTIELKRPFAQVNVATKDEMKAGSTAAALDYDGATSSLTIKQIATEFKPLGSEQFGAPADVSFEAAAAPGGTISVNNVDYNYLSVNYVFAPAERSVYDIVATLALKDGKTVKVNSPATPLQSNYRTNIIGALFTSTADFSVELTPGFGGEEEVISNEASLRALFATGGEAKLYGDVDITVAESISVGEGKEVTLDLNGHKISNSVDLWKDSEPAQVCVISVDSGTLTIKGKGGVAAKANDCYTFNVKNGGKLVIEDGEYVGNISVIQVQEGLVEISGGKFSLIQTWPGAGPDGCDFMVNMIDAAYKAGIAKAVVTGGEFVKFNPADCAAEGAHTNFLAAGYKSTQIGDSYFVTKAGVTPVADQEGMNTAISGDGTSKDKPITVELPSNTTVTLDNGIANEGDKSRNITFVGDGTQTFDVITKAINAEGGMLNYQRGSSFIFKNLTIKAGEGDFDGIVCDELTFENCTLTGSRSLYGKATFVNCVFENTMANQYSIRTWGGTDVKFDKCTFNTNGKAILLYGKATEAKPTNLIVTNCTLNDRKNGAAGKAAIEIGNDYNATYSLTIANCTVNGFAEGKNTGSKLWANKNSMDAEHLSVTIDGTKVQ